MGMARGGRYAGSRRTRRHDGDYEDMAFCTTRMGTNGRMRYSRKYCDSVARIPICDSGP